MKSVLATITTHKRKPEMVERAIKSVVAQTYTDWDLVVVDDSPADYEFRDDVRKMVEGWSRRDSRIRYVPHDKNYGASHARNTALKIAYNEGFEFIGYLDDDDEWLPEKLEKQIAKFNARDENTALVYCRSYIMNDEGKITGMEFEYNGEKRPLHEGNIFDKLIIFDFIGTCTNPMIRTKFFNDTGGFDEDIPAREDWDAWLRLAKKYKISYVDEGLMIYHSHNNEHLGRNPVTQRIGFEKILAKNWNYIKDNKYAHWSILTKIAKSYAQSKEYGKSFMTGLKAVSLQPLRIKANMKTLLRPLLLMISPKLFEYLRNIKRELKGEKMN